MPTPPSPKITVVPLIVRPTDMDADRNVNNARYFEYFEFARHEHLLRLDVFQHTVPVVANFMSVAENTCRYLAPAYYGDSLLIWVLTHTIGNSSFQLVYRVWREKDEALIAAGHSVQVWMDENNKPTPLPNHVRESLEKSHYPDIPPMPARD